MLLRATQSRQETVHLLVHAGITVLPKKKQTCVSIVCMYFMIMDYDQAQVCVFTAALNLLLANQAQRRGRAYFHPLHPSIASSPSSPLPSLVHCAAERSGRQTSLGCDLIKGRRVNVMNSQPITLIWAHLTCLRGARERERGEGAVGWWWGKR